MSLTKLSLPVSDYDWAQTLAHLLCELEPAAAAVSVFRDVTADGWQIDAYYEACALSAAVQALRQAAHQDAERISVEALTDRNWVAISQSALAPVSAGRFLVHGSHDRATAQGRRRYAIEIDAGEAFGTAHHASTRGCLTALDKLIRRRTFRLVLDLGCGSGILGIAAARLLPSARVLASDIDPRAIDVARTNAHLNGVAARAEFVTAVGLSHPALRQPGKFDLVLANILAEPLMTLAPQLRAALTPGGHVILSGLLNREVRQVAAAYAAAGFAHVRSQTIDGWATLTLRRR